MRDLSDILGTLGEFHNLIELNLSNNQLREMPRDLSHLAQLVLLNINGNQFQKVRHHLWMIKFSLINFWNHCQLYQISLVCIWI